LPYDFGMSSVSTHYVYLAANPRSAYQQLFVKGTRVRARVLYGWYACSEPMTPEAIAAEYNLPVAAVLEAIAYCQANPPELLADYAREEALMQATGMNDPNYKYHPAPRLLTPQERAGLQRS
jgi:uncharacterized protein (DUF433 family)